MLIDRKLSLDCVNEPQVFDQKFIYNTKVPLKAAKMPLPSRQLKKTVTENDTRKSLDNDFFVLFTIVTGGLFLKKCKIERFHRNSQSIATLQLDKLF